MHFDRRIGDGVGQLFKGAFQGSAAFRQLGIELRRSWALRFLRRATVPLIAGMVILAWAVTGLTSLPLDRRAVYERFGVPVAVFGPGLHLHLPWPFGLLRPVEMRPIDRYDDDRERSGFCHRHLAVRVAAGKR